MRDGRRFNLENFSVTWVHGGPAGRNPVLVADDIGFESCVTDHLYGGMSHGVTADCKSAAFTHSWFDSSTADHF